MSSFVLQKIVSGGQTGVDRGALDAAIELEFEHGGWCPAGRRSEAGRIPKRYLLHETRKRNYAIRTEKNVVDSDGTLILFRNQMTGGTELTYRLALKHQRPSLCLDLNLVARDENEFDDCRQLFFDWLMDHSVETLNVAGPRESTSAGIQVQSKMFLLAMLRAVKSV